MFSVTRSKLAVMAALVVGSSLTTTAQAVSYTDAVAASNPQYWYRFEGTTLGAGVENVGSTAAFDGTYGAGITAANLGKTSAFSGLGNAMEFTGPAAANNTNKFVDFGAAIPELVNLRSAPQNKSSTVEYWVNTSQLGNNANTWQNPSIFARESPGDGDMYWGNIDNAGNFRFSTSDIKEISATGVANGQWHHVVMTKTWNDVGTSSSTMHIDGGALVGGGRTFTANTGAGAASNQDNDSPISRLGYTQNGEQSNTQFIGQIDEVAIYNRAITASEAASHYNAGTGALVGLYRFEGAVGTDSSARNNNLLANGNAAQGAGKFGGGLLLDGNGDFLSVNAGATAAPNGLSIGDGSYAIAAWFKPDAGTNPQGQQEGIVGWGNYGTGNQVTAIRMNGASGMSHYWWDFDQSAGTPNLVDGLFHHVVAMYDSTTGIRSLVVDGVVIATDNPADHNAIFSNFTIGRTASGVFGLNEWFDGTLDDVAIFNRALTTQEITAIRAGDFSAFLAAASIPEPATALTGLLGMTLLAIRRRRLA